MRIAYLDCSSGISGDMTLAALIDCGASIERIQSAVDSMGLGATLSMHQVRKRGFRAQKLHIDVPKDPAHRDLDQILECISRARISPQARRIAVRIFERIAKVEASVHGMPIDQVHFHEVGAIDSIVDIVGTAVAWDELQIEQAIASPVPTGTGFVQIAHGRVSLPAPATAELLKGVPLAACGLPFEMTTPTGAAILAELVATFGPLPAMQVASIGLGAGTRDLEDRPNILRIFLGTDGSKQVSQGLLSDTIVVLQTNLDDIAGEQIGFAIERIWEAGALDVFTTSIQMKKNRPGTMLSVISNPETSPAIEQAIFKHTGTLGVRKSIQHRSVLERRMISVNTPWGSVPCKSVVYPDGSKSLSPEYEACRKIALEHRLKLSEVIRIIENSREIGL